GTSLCRRATMLRRFLPIIALALAACTTTPTYQAAVSPGGPGYSETQIESGRFTVSYRANGAADAETLQDYALLHAAELTLQHNRDWFWVDRRSVDTSRSGYGGPSLGVSVGGASFGRHTATGVGLGMSFPIGRPHQAATAATLDIRFGEGVKPDDANAY